MIPLFALALIVLTVLNYAVSRSLIYPPLLFCAVWAVQMVGLQITGDYFFPMEDTTLWVFFFGALAFTAGGLLAMLLKLGPPKAEPDAQTLRYIDVILKVSFVIGLILLPFYWNYLRSLVGGGDVANFWKELRMATLEHAETDARDVNPILASIPFFSLLATISLYEFCRTGLGWLRACCGILISLIYHLGSTARSEVLILIVSLFAAVWFRSPKKALRWGALAMCGFFVLFFFNQLKVEKAGSRADESVANNLPQFARGLAIYSLGSAVAFDGSVRNPGLIPNTFPITGYFTRALNKFGFQLEDPVPFLQNIAVNTAFSINAYTVYFSYYSDYGMFGTSLFMAAFGFVTTFVFRKASRNDPAHVLLFGLAMYCTLTSFFADFFVLEMGFWFKAFAVGVIFYRIIPAIVRYKQRPAVSPAAIA